MARNGSGTYNLLTNSWNPATNGVSATAVDWQNLINDVAAALTQSLSADGQTPITGNINMGGNRLTNLSAPSTTGDALSQGNNASVLNFTVTGSRITGDFSSATLANRVMFQTSTANGATVVGALPNGSGTAAGFLVHNTNDASNSARGYIGASAGEVSFQSDKTGTGTYLPMTFSTGGSERMRIDTIGNVGVGVPTPANYGNANSRMLTVLTGDQNTTIGAYWQSGVGQFGFVNSGSTNNVSPMPLVFQTGGTERMRIDASGNVLVTNNTGSLGYGTGSGGTVTQTTSKSTAVTLNRPTGIIVMNNASLAAGASVTFDVNNSLLFGNWLVLVSTADVNYRVSVDSVAGGKFVVRVTNSNVIPLADDVNVKFAIIRVSNT